MKHNKREWVSRRCIIALVVLSMMLLTACAGDPAGDVSPTIVEEEESQQPVQVKKSGYEFTYSGTMADVITIKELEDSNNLEFTAKVGQQEFTIFIMHFNAEEGDLVEFIQISFQENHFGNQASLIYKYIQRLLYCQLYARLEPLQHLRHRMKQT